MKARYVGIDIGKFENTAHLLNAEQEKIDSFKFKHSICEYENIIEHLDGDSRIVMEPTGVYGLNLFVYLKNKGYQVRFCDTRESSEVIKSQTGGVKQKTDDIDACGLALHCVINWKRCRDNLPFVSNIHGYSNTLFYIRIKEMLQEIRLLGIEIGSVKNKINALLNLRFPELSYIFKTANPIIALRFMCLDKKDYSFPSEEILRFVNGNKNYLKYIEAMKTRFMNSLAVQTGLFDCKVVETRQLVREYDILRSEKSHKEKLLKQLISSTDFVKLYRENGFDTIYIATIITEVRDISRFFIKKEDGSVNLTKSLKAFRRYCGFVITSNQSGSREGGHTLAKAGNFRLREMLYLMALSHIALKNGEVYEYYLEKSKRMVKKKAILKTANHLCAKVFFLIKDLRWDF